MADSIADGRAMDRAIWATWYDIAQSAREDYLPWLHKIYLPEVLGCAGYLSILHFKGTGSFGR